VVEALRRRRGAEVPGLIEGWLDALDADGRWALLKLLTGGLARRPLGAAGQAGGGGSRRRGVSESRRSGTRLSPPTATSSPGWKAAASGRPPTRRPLPPGDAGPGRGRGADFAKLDPADYAAEWKWDGIRVQARQRARQRRLYSRTGDDISAAFPDVVAALDFEGVIDGELLVMRDGAVAPFGDLQQRLNRKTADAKLMAAHPAGIRAYDLLLDGRRGPARPAFRERRARLEAFVGAHRRRRIDLSPLQPFEGWDALAPARRAAAGRRSPRRGADAQALGQRSMRPAGPRARGSSGSAIR
jgi:DNA ligase-1